MHFLNLAYEIGELSISQRRGLIIVLFKKGDQLVTKNWHPISLLNVDYEIATHALADWLLPVISTVVSPDQTCGVPGRSIAKTFLLFGTLSTMLQSRISPSPFSPLIKRRPSIVSTGDFSCACWRPWDLVPVFAARSPYFILILNLP